MSTHSSTEVRQAAELMALQARIEALEAALQEISEMYPRENRAVVLACAALDKDKS